MRRGGGGGGRGFCCDARLFNDALGLDGDVDADVSATEADDFDSDVRMERGGRWEEFSSEDEVSMRASRVRAGFNDQEPGLGGGDSAVTSTLIGGIDNRARLALECVVLDRLIWLCRRASGGVGGRLC